MTADEVVFRDATLIVGRERWGKAVLRIRIRKFLGLPDPDPLVRGMDPDPFLEQYCANIEELSGRRSGRAT